MSHVLGEFLPHPLVASTLDAHQQVELSAYWKQCNTGGLPLLWNVSNQTRHRGLKILWEASVQGQIEAKTGKVLERKKVEILTQFMTKEFPQIAQADELSALKVIFDRICGYECALPKERDRKGEQKAMQVAAAKFQIERLRAAIFEKVSPMREKPLQGIHKLSERRIIGLLGGLIKLLYYTVQLGYNLLRWLFGSCFAEDKVQAAYDAKFRWVILIRDDFFKICIAIVDILTLGYRHFLWNSDYETPKKVGRDVMALGIALLVSGGALAVIAGTVAGFGLPIIAIVGILTTGIFLTTSGVAVYNNNPNHSR